MRHLRMLMWILVLVPVSLHGEPPEPQQNSGTKLHAVFSDDFSKDSLSDCQLKGEAAVDVEDFLAHLRGLQILAAVDS